jgi:hypothetical protein
MPIDLQHFRGDYVSLLYLNLWRALRWTHPSPNLSPGAIERCIFCGNNIRHLRSDVRGITWSNPLTQRRAHFRTLAGMFRLREAQPTKCEKNHK